MTVITRPFTDEERREGLRWLAEHEDDTSEIVRLFLLMGWAAPSLTDSECDEAWAEFRLHHADCLALQDGTKGWAEVYPDLLNGDRQQAAIEMALQEADEALDLLVQGAEGAR